MDIYLDNAATTYPKPDAVYSAMSEGYRINGFSPSRGSYPAAKNVESTVYDLRVNLAKLLGGICKPHDIVFTPSATVAINLILQGFQWRPTSNTVYLTVFEHNAVLRTLNFLEDQLPIETQNIPLDDCHRIKISQLKARFSRYPPDLVVLPHSSNVTGVVFDIDSVVELAHSHGAKVMVDGAQAAGVVPIGTHMPDYYIFSGHKSLYGPTGIGGVCITDDSIAPFYHGGTGINSSDRHMPSTRPDRYEAGTKNIVGILGLEASVNWLLLGEKYKTIVPSIVEHVRFFRSQVDSSLIEPVGPGSTDPYDNTGIISCRTRGISPKELAAYLAEHGIAVRDGLHCAPSAHRFLGTYPEGTIRFSLSHFTTEEEIEHVLNTINDL